MQGDLASAVRWLEMADLATDPGVMFFWLEVPHITQCRILIAQGSEASLQEAGEKLAVYRKTNETQNNTRQLIDILLLQSLIYQKQSQSDKALAALTRAITLAEPGGFIRPFLDLGPEMAGLLVRLSQRGVAPEYIARILAAFPDEMKDERSSSGDGWRQISSVVCQYPGARSFVILGRALNTPGARCAGAPGPRTHK